MTRPLTPAQIKVLQAAADGDLCFDRATVYIRGDKSRRHYGLTVGTLGDYIAIEGDTLRDLGTYTITVEGRKRLAEIKRRRKVRQRNHVDRNIKKVD